MIVDTSAIMAIALLEPEAEAFMTRLGSADTPRISAGSWIELSVVVLRRHPEKADLVDRIMQRFGITVEPVTIAQGRIAREAYARFGQVSRHPAHLNFGDCFAYALARSTGQPLLFKGDDFIHTDITPAA
ncbi:type II toxin-antitoxin system VapC family toxin [Sphingomonas sp.]|uniref:type II toxin-antitoxin system VapC family toxin n=1 Tax=Sphingomonas sp. TaxID=28214 RepID=UPI00307F4358